MAPSFAPTDTADSFADLLSTFIIFVRGKLAGGERYWAYLAMKPSMAKAFKDAQKKGTAFDLEEYGTIIEWDKGDEPPIEVVERMKTEYAFDSDYEKKLLKRLDALT